MAIRMMMANINKNNCSNNLSFAEVRANRIRGLVTHTEQSDECFRLAEQLHKAV